MNKLKELLKREEVRYLIIGGCTTLVNLVVFNILVEVLHWNVDFSNVISIIISIIFAFITNKLIVFQSKVNTIKDLFYEFIKFVGGRGITMIIEVGGVYLLYNIVNLPAMFAKTLTQVIVIILNYFISKYFVFK